MTTRAINLQVNADVQPIVGLRQQLLEVKKEIDLIAAADVVDEDKLQDAVNRMAELRDRTSDVNAKVKEVATGSEFEKMSNSVKGVGKSLMTLNFDKASQSAKNLTNTIQNLNPAAMSKQFMKFAGVLGTLGKAVGTLTITFVKMGISLLTNPIFLLVAVIVAIVAAIVIFLDKIGVVDKVLTALMLPINLLIKGFKKLTDWLGFTNHAGKEEEEQIRKSIQAYDDKAKAIQKQTDTSTFYMNEELRILKSLDDGSEESKQKIIDKEREILIVKRESYKEQVKLAEANLQTMLISGKFTKDEYDEQIEKIKDLRKSLTVSVNDVKVFNNELQKELKKENDKKALATEEEAKKNAESDKKEKDRKDKEARARRKQKEDDDEKEKQIAKKRALDIKRLLEDIDDKAIKDEELRADAITKRRLERARDDFKETKIFEKAIKEQQDKLIESFNDDIALIDKQRTDKDKLKKEEEERLQAEHLSKMNKLELDFKKISLNPEDFEARKVLIQEQYDEELRLLKESLLNKQISQEEYDQIIKNNKLKLDKELADVDKNEKKRQKDLQDAKIDMAFAATSALQNLILSFEKDNEKSAKKMFKINKAFQLGQAVANTALAVTAALTAGGNPAKLATGAQFVEAGIAATMGAANIATIAKQQFGSASTSTPNTNSGSSNQSNNFDRMIPSVIFNQNENANNIQSFGNNNGNNTNNIILENNVSISETEITEVQKRNLKLQNNATL